MGIRHHLGMKRCIGLLAMAAALAACGGNSSGITAATTHSPAALTPSATTSAGPAAINVNVVLVIRAGSSDFPNYAKTSVGCKGINAESDHRKGEGVTVYGGSGDVVGTGFVKETLISKHTCVLLAPVRGMRSEPFYKVQFGNGNKLAFSRAQLLNKTAATFVG